MQRERLEWLQQFKEVMQAKYPDSWRTHATYNSICAKFLSEFEGNPKRASTKELIRYVSELKPSQMRPMHGVLKNLYKHVFKQPNKIGFIPFAKRPEKIKIIPRHDQIVKMIEGIKNTKHKMIVSMLYGTGLRLSEFLNLKFSDIHRTKEPINPLLLHIRQGKGKKDRIVPLSKRLHDDLKVYCKEYGLNANCKECYVFEGVGGKMYSASSVQAVVEQASLSAGLPKMSPHDLRHACLTELSKSVSPLTVMKIAGHKQLATTERYIHPVFEEIKMPLD